MDQILFKNLVASMPGHIYWKDKNGVYLGCNQRQAQSLGFHSPEDIIGKTDFDISPTQLEAEVFWKNDQEIMQTGEIKIVEEAALYEGKPAIMLSQKVPLRNEQNDIIGILGISFDITEQKKREKALKKAKNLLETSHKIDKEALVKMVQQITGQSIDQKKSSAEYAQMMCNYYENIIAVMPGNVYWKDKAGIVLGCNNQQAQILGLKSRQELIGKTTYELYDKKMADKIKENDLKLLETNSSKIVEEKFLPMVDGEPSTYLAHKIPLHDTKGNVIGLLGISFDITENKKQEKELQKAKIREKAQEERIRTMEAIGASIAHELRTPLRAISSAISGVRKFLPNLIHGYQLAKKANLDTPHIQSRHIKALNRVAYALESETQFANTVIDMFLMKIRPIIIQKKDLVVCSAVQSVDEAISRYPFEQEELELLHWEPKDDFEFMGNSLLFIHVLFNLIKNALYYIAKAGKGEITIWIERGPKFNQLHFKDTGTGISSEILPNIFNKFFTKTHGGSGVGLTFCDIVMKGFGGKITCDSKMDRYTEFVLSFPVVN